MKSAAPKQVVERRRYERVPKNYMVAMFDRSGRALFRGHSADISVGGVRVLGYSYADFGCGKLVWVEITLPDAGGSVRRPPRILKMAGEVRRLYEMDGWKVVSVAFESDLPLPSA